MQIGSTLVFIFLACSYYILGVPCLGYPFESLQHLDLHENALYVEAAIGAKTPHPIGLRTNRE